jgi:hypothetical protein
MGPSSAPREQLLQLFELLVRAPSVYAWGFPANVRTSTARTADDIALDSAPSAPYPKHSMSPYARLQVVLLLGNVAFIGAWAAAVSRPPGWLWIGIVLLALFVAVRVGGMWLRARKYPDETGRSRRAAILSTFVAVLGVALWIYTALRGPR